VFSHRTPLKKVNYFVKAHRAVLIILIEMNIKSDFINPEIVGFYITLLL